MTELRELTRAPLGRSPTWSMEDTLARFRRSGPRWPKVRAAVSAGEALVIGAAATGSIRLLLSDRPQDELAAAAIFAATPLVLILSWLQHRYRADQLASPRCALAAAGCTALAGGGSAALAIAVTSGGASRSVALAAASWAVIATVVLLFRLVLSVWLWQQLLARRLDYQVGLIAPRGTGDLTALANALAEARGQPCRLSWLEAPGQGAPPGKCARALAAAARAMALDEVLILAGPLFERGLPASFGSIPDPELFERLRYLRCPVSLAWTTPGDPNGDVLLTPIIRAPLGDLDRAIKRSIDVVGASVLLLICLPLFGLAALAIKLEGPGPVLFRQQRRGLDNAVFEMLKFRSMHVALCDPLALRLTTRADGRVTRVGRILRRWSLDELPQLLNVIRGTMSLVGPRPHPLEARAGERRYEDVIADLQLRYRVKPGMTGWAQVNGLRGNTDSEDKLIRRFEYDMDYIRRWSVWLDLKILMRTPFASIVGENAY